jgi:hypothetical protein
MFSLNLRRYRIGGSRVTRAMSVIDVSEEHLNVGNSTRPSASPKWAGQRSLADRGRLDRRKYEKYESDSYKDMSPGA